MLFIIVYSFSDLTGKPRLWALKILVPSLCTELSTDAVEKGGSLISGLKDKANPEMKYSDKIKLTEIQCLHITEQKCRSNDNDY